MSLIRWQFHVDKLSSAHIYLRLREGEAWENIPKDLLTDLAQLTKANSIEGEITSTAQNLVQAALTQEISGNKKDNITVIYTPWSNLKKDGSMAVGQVSFKDQRKVGRRLFGQDFSVRFADIFSCSGQEDPCRTKREPHRQPAQQDQG